MALCSLSAAAQCLPWHPGAPVCHLRAVTGLSPLQEAFPTQEPVLWGQQSVPKPDGLGQELRSSASPSPRMFGVRWYRLASVCVSVRSRECVQRLYVTPRAAESSGSVPRQSMTPRQVGVSPGTCFPPQPKPSFEQSKKEVQRPAAPGPPAEGLLQSRQEPEAEKQAALNKGTALGPAGPTPAGTLCQPGAPSILLGPCPYSPGGFSLVFRFAPQWASSPPGPSLRRRRRWCPRSACQGGAPVAWPTGSAPG